MRRPLRCAVRVVAAIGLIAGAPALAVRAHAAVPDVALAPPVTLAADATPAAQPAPAAAPKAKAPKAPKVAKPKSPPHVHKPEDGPWDRGALWITLRAGYNQASYSTAGEGSLGYGFGFTRMLGSAWGLTGITGRDVIGQFGDATESEIPFTLELDRHIKLGETFRLYGGVGGGTYYHKFSNTTADFSDVRGGALIAAGGNIVISKRNLFGLDGRMAFVSSKSDVPASNPVFGPQKSSTTRWSIKATWSVTY